MVLSKNHDDFGKVERWADRYRKDVEDECRKNRGKKYIGASKISPKSTLRKTTGGFEVEVSAASVPELPPHLRLEQSINDLYQEVLKK